MRFNLTFSKNKDNENDSSVDPCIHVTKKYFSSISEVISFASFWKNNAGEIYFLRSFTCEMCFCFRGFSELYRHIAVSDRVECKLVVAILIVDT